MGSFAVIDLETTGLNPYRQDRIIEVAIVLWSPGRGITAELETLVNPERDIGPTSIHGIAASDIVHAPRFAEITDNLHDFLRGSLALVGHNIRFDVSFLRSEYSRIGVEIPDYVTIDTMSLAGGGRLSACCAEYGIEHGGKLHSALHDARATANLFQTMFLRSPKLLARYKIGDCPAWPIFRPSRGDLLPRGIAVNTYATGSSYVSKLAACLSVGSSSDISQTACETDYQRFLWRALEDGKLEESEERALLDVALHWGLSLNQVKAIHLDYLARLAKAACADGAITDAERREFWTISQLLGLGLLSDNEIQAYANLPEPQIESAAKSPEVYWSGKTVCFTGECCCYIKGELISRNMAEHLAASKGLQISPRVTKKLDLLIVADPNTQSGKAKKAREYGVRILHEPVFWRSLGIVID